MELGIRVRPAVEQDAPGMARVHVESWRETYRGLMSDSVLDDPDFVANREKFWTAALTDPRYAANQVAVAERDSVLIGIAMAGPALIWLGGLSRGQGEAASRTVVVDAASVDRWRALLMRSVSVSTRRQSDMRGLVTAGRAVRLERTAV